MKVEAIKHANVLGKEQMYCKITNEEGKFVVIQIGQKNFDDITELTKQKTVQSELPLTGKTK